MGRVVGLSGAGYRHHLQGHRGARIGDSDPLSDHIGRALTMLGWDNISDPTVGWLRPSKPAKPQGRAEPVIGGRPRLQQADHGGVGIVRRGPARNRSDR